MSAICECYNSGCEKITDEEYEYLSKFSNELYKKYNYFIMTIKCAELEKQNGECEIIETFGNACLTYLKTIK